MTSLAPIALFVHKDAERASAILDALRQCDLAKRSVLTIYCDGPQSPDDIDDVESVREVARSADGFDAINIVESPEFQGRSKILVDAVTDTVRRHGKVIVVEDNLFVSPPFLRFMNDGLDRFADDDRFISVCGFTYNLQSQLAETFLLKGAHCWGWATWQRGWDLFCPDPGKLVDELIEHDQIYSFDGGGAEPLSQALQESVSDQQTSWSLCWMASALLHGKFTVYPGRSLVANVDYSTPGSGVASVFESQATADAIVVEGLPVEADIAAVDELRRVLIQWRGYRNNKVRLFFLMMKFLPRSLEKALYSALIRAKLRRS
jgi:hypothetical protein